MGKCTFSWVQKTNGSNIAEVKVEETVEVEEAVEDAMKGEETLKIHSAPMKEPSINPKRQD